VETTSAQDGPVSERLVAALAMQLAERRALLGRGAAHVGWKLGVGDRERIDGEVAVGHLTSATRLSSCGSYVARTRDVDLRADVEIAVQLRRHVGASDEPALIRKAIAHYAVALEIVDLSALPNEPFDVVVANVFHRAVAFGDTRAGLPPRPRGTVIVNGEPRRTAEAEADVAERVRAAARVLEAAGERLTPGDWLITGSIVQTPVGVGDEIVADLGELGAVSLTVAAARPGTAAAER
jgi:2-keto-4-pentenoate hydratase